VQHEATSKLRFIDFYPLLLLIFTIRSCENFSPDRIGFYNKKSECLNGSCFLHFRVYHKKSRNTGFFSTSTLHSHNWHFSSRDHDLKLKRVSLVIGGFTTFIFLLCFSLVGVTLHLTPEMNKLASEFWKYF